MKTWTRSLILLAGMSFAACTHNGKGGEPTAFLSASTDCSAVSQIICTREYAPTNCALGDQSFSGNNACEARKAAKAYACEKKIAFVESELTCAGNVAQAPEDNASPVPTPTPTPTPTSKAKRSR